mmetsp:Transcript_50958/g.84464  ORF Transcript_50958/g.84464 Transcript_50958/m.84464 type:complete len:121 (+) Transcript_50958:79-441(+)|eukprot:CAMPEP_0119314170 /NCGR_PEP_ID=MMETSP1333-20130426/31948_1 /TAXON_ID=418940 /ORGANISM="Scyphosphaera apsteinii, Strain RCC1455" /LENGTH=120 /DNA_ID=CAMNT_0007319229 /DNA_START=88 /DNA_END=450 /DNA_ORIENTATION=-
MKVVSLFVAVASAVPHHGAYVDPKHYMGTESFAGLRFISEGPPHALTLIGTDDGNHWFTLMGTCSGPGMATITFDFSSKGGPAKLVGTAQLSESGLAQIVWPDGNAWTKVNSPVALPAAK